MTDRVIPEVEPNQRVINLLDRMRAKTTKRPWPMTYSVGIGYDHEGNFSIQVNDVSDSAEDRKRVARDLMDAALLIDPDAKPERHNPSPSV